MRAEVTAVFNVATVQLHDGDQPYGDAWSVRKEDGPGPVPAAEAVLERMGWRLAGEWTQTAGGISGGVWEASVERADDEDGCEGHYDDDAALLRGGIGEPYYCDGTCN